MSKIFTYKSAVLLVALSLAGAVQSNVQKTNTSTGAVFLMTNSNSGNEILQFVRNPNGSLVSVGKTPTGGNGSGGTTDPLASQNSPLLTSDSRFLLTEFFFPEWRGGGKECPVYGSTEPRRRDAS
jgi:hypothetical protein